jgi:hypothetical protein
MPGLFVQEKSLCQLHATVKSRLMTEKPRHQVIFLDSVGLVHFALPCCGLFPSRSCDNRNRLPLFGPRVKRKLQEGLSLRLPSLHLISVNPFFLEYVPFESTIRATRLSLEVSSQNTHRRLLFQMPPLHAPAEAPRPDRRGGADHRFCGPRLFGRVMEESNSGARSGGRAAAVDDQAAAFLLFVGVSAGVFVAA